MIDGGVSPCSAVSPGCVGRTIGGQLALISGNQGVWDSEALRGNQGAIKGL